MLRFRAPGATFQATGLVARALAESVERAAERVRSGALAEERGTQGQLRLKQPDAAIAPGTLLQLDARAPRIEFAAAHFEALTPALPWRSGRCEGFTFETLEEHAGVARLRLALDGASLDAVRAWLAAAGAAVLGDVSHGGILIAGGLRLWPASDEKPSEVEASPARSEAEASEVPASPARSEAQPSEVQDRWPDEPVFPPPAPAPEARFRISAGTARALERGHPWVMADDQTESGERFAPGTLVTLTGSDGRPHGLARSEGSRDLAAVAWSATARTREVASIEERVARALTRRKALLAPDSVTDAVRLVHGEADGLPGLAVDRLGSLLRVLVTGRSALPLRERVLAALRSARLPGLDADPLVIEVMHLRERPPGELLSVRVVAGDPAALAAPLWVREGGLRFRIDPGLAEPTRPRPGVGFFIDQRDNRARLAERAARGGCFLNLFAHTGGFSAALLAGGADEVWSVDLSGPYLAQLEENLERSGLALARHRSLRREARRCLDELEPAQRFAGIVLDPPTAAASGRRFWSVRRDLEPLATAALARLTPGGFLLLTRQDRAGRSGLDALLERAAAAASVRLRSIESAPPGADFPALRGFPEAAPFEAVLATRE